MNIPYQSLLCKLFFFFFGLETCFVFSHVSFLRPFCFLSIIYVPMFCFWVYLDVPVFYQLVVCLCMFIFRPVSSSFFFVYSIISIAAAYKSLSFRSFMSCISVSCYYLPSSCYFCMLLCCFLLVSRCGSLCSLNVLMIN